MKNLDPSIDNKALFDTFSLFGNILSCKVVTDQRTGESKGYGFVHFETMESGKEAIAKINGLVLAGKEVFVGEFVKRGQRPGQKEFTNLYVKGLPLHWDSDRLKLEFEKAGPISSAVVVMQTKEEEETTVSRGFGFVDFVDHDSAAKAITMFNEKVARTIDGEKATQDEVDAEQEARKLARAEKKEDKEAAAAKAEGSKETKEGKEEAVKEETTEEPAKEEKKMPLGCVLLVTRAQKKIEREQELSKKFEALKVERQNNFQGVNLFVKNLAPEIDNEILRKEFGVHGSITSARVMRDLDKAKASLDSEGNMQYVSKGFGFVCFSNPEEATKAVTEMNGAMINGKPLYVALAQHKDQRRQQLESQFTQRGQPGRAMPMGGPNMYGQQGFYQGVPMMAGQQGGRQQYFPQQQMMGRNGQPQQMMQPPRMGGGQFPQGGRMNYPPQQMAGNGQFPQGQMMGNMGYPQQRGGQRQPRQGQRQAGNQQAPQQASRPALEPLTAAALANASKEDQKNMIGERLYPLIKTMVDPVHTGKITGMLLEMDNPELLHLLESPDALKQKCQEALVVLEQHIAK